MVAELGGPGMDVAMAESFQMVGKVATEMSSEEVTLKENLEDEKWEEEDGAPSFPAALDSRVSNVGSSSDSAGIGHMDALMKTMNRLDELSREAENCWAWMKATYLDDEKWYRVRDEVSMEDSTVYADSDSVRRQDTLEQNIIELVEEKHTQGVVEKDDFRDPHGNRVGHVNLSWGSGFRSETIDEEKECENIDDDELKNLTQADLPLSMCSPKSEHLSSVNGRLNIPARSPGTPELETRKTRSDTAGEVHRVQQAVAKQIWFKFEGKTRAIDIWGRDSEIEEEIREKMRIDKTSDFYMRNEGKVVGWRDLEEIRDGGMVEIGLRMRGGGKKKKGMRSGNQRGNLVSGGESTGSEETENSTEDEAKKDAVLHEIMSKAKLEGGPMHEMIETLAVLGQREREEMLRWYEDRSKAKHTLAEEVGMLGVRWMVEKKIEENQGMLKEEVMKDGMKKGVFREGNSPDEIIDFGKHAVKTFKDVYLTDQEYCSWTMKQERPGARKLVEKRKGGKTSKKSNWRKHGREGENGTGKAERKQNDRGMAEVNKEEERKKKGLTQVTGVIRNS